MTLEQLEQRNAAIRRAWDDPLARALMRAKKLKTPIDYPTRDQEIWAAYHSGKITLKALGRKYDISHERVRQIHAKICRQKGITYRRNKWWMSE